ncbi:transglycosylase SLT domain-containing protein [Paraburkholderia phytofirmans]|uniref:Lytic transglycosylase catalytic n=1 Tax=Paraburkholderia phytofirmans (strain DSM 17436 / LMG 22146 / PsJN) TaxID=398527 RepID=B2TH76_PARPJ|nr:transglycosylase SLT domain-containing protein [Paraburkholderia phytofirmans]ACD21629.1 Lytic transglycosylase catalytic [Paraburkholderia phytofirmans PsJN]
MPGVDRRLSASLVRQESNFNPYAIGLDGKEVLYLQPRSYQEAVQTAVNLMREGKGFSVGLSQIHISNVRRYGMTWQQAFDPCSNLMAGGSILKGFYSQAVNKGYRGQDAVFAALRGFNSGDVGNSISNGYASSILRRVSNMPVSGPVPIPVVPVGTVTVTPVTVDSVAQGSPEAVLQPVSVPANGGGEPAPQARADMFAAAKPSMFATATRSMFAGKSASTTTPPPTQVVASTAGPTPVMAVSAELRVQTRSTNAGEDDDGPVPVRVVQQ